LRVRQQLQRVGKRLLPQPLKTIKSRRTLVLPEVLSRCPPKAQGASTGGEVQGRGEVGRNGVGLHYVPALAAASCRTKLP
jgi:hypothetical protein